MQIPHDSLQTNSLHHEEEKQNIYILREKSLAIYFEGSQFRRNMTFNFIMSKIYVDKRSRVRLHKHVGISHNVKSDFMPPC